jgi:hypothetical protein
MAIFSERRPQWLGFCLVAAVSASAPLAYAASSTDASGRYSILREGDKDTGCMLTLDARTRGRAGLKAQLAPACRDNGVVIFDPVGWDCIELNNPGDVPAIEAVLAARGIA